MGKEGIRVSSVDVEKLLKMLNGAWQKSGWLITNTGLEHGSWKAHAE